MSCDGKNARIYAIKEGVTSTVHLFNDSMAPSTKIKTVHVKYAHDTQCSCTFILQVNYCLDFTKTMEHPILCTNQARAHAEIINDYPKLFDKLSS